MFGALTTPDQHGGDVALALVAAYLLALPLGWERKARGTGGVGLRTMPLVSVATCAYLLLSRFVYESGIFDADGLARAMRAVMTGIGFIGGGAILKHARGVRGVVGVTTAASIWTTGAIGASVAHGYYSLAVVLALTALLVISFTGRLARTAPAIDRER
ncbi:MgtC/SapB family protein [Vulgatibacter sp.]|uniref:MgtC/SapB family protein n=1 Tax=Vulgatibacter sp. TaxID=1971226 RepID=UPI00356194D5